MGGGNWGTLRIRREDWGTLGKIRGITTPLKNPINLGKIPDIFYKWIGSPLTQNHDPNPLGDFFW